MDITSDNEALCEQGGGVINPIRHICKYDFNVSSQAVCEAAGGTWENDACTAAPPYNCTTGALCSYWAAEYPEEIDWHTNDYVGDNAGEGNAAA